MGSNLLTETMKLNELHVDEHPHQPMQLILARKHLARGGKLALVPKWDGKTRPPSTSAIIMIGHDVHDMPHNGDWVPGVRLQLSDGPGRPGFDYALTFDELENMQIHFMPGDEDHMILVSRNGAV